MTRTPPSNVVAITRPEGGDTLSKLAHEINVRLQRADDHRLSASLKLAEAKAACKDAGISFKLWVSKEIKHIGYGEATVLAKIGEAPEPAKALEDLRQKTAAKVKASRAAQGGSSLRNKLSETSAPTAPQRGKAAICARVREAILGLAGLPPAASVANDLRGTDDAILITERLIEVHRWLNEFTSIWEEQNAD